MTKGEAINRMKYIQECGGYITKEMREALDMAISALKKQIPERPKRIITNKEVAGNFQSVCPSC